MLHRPAAAVLGLIALAVAAGGSGCAAGESGERGGAGRTEPAVAVSQPRRPVVSPGESLRVIDDYVARYNKAVAAADGRAWRDLLAEPMASIADAGLRIGHGRPPDRETISLVNPVLFVPKLDAFPTWFMVAAMERAGANGKPHQTLMIFTRSEPNATWRLANKTITSAKLPKIATDEQGYAVAVPAEGPPGRLAVPFADLAAAHAAYLAGGTNATNGITANGATNGAGAGTFADGPYTSEWRTERAAWTRRMDAAGWRDTATFAQTRYQPIALRTKDGGILAWYAVSRLDSLFPDRASRERRAGGPPESGDSDDSGERADPAAISADIRDYLGGPPGGSRTEVRAAWLLLPLTYVPPAGGGGRPAVLGQIAGLTSAATIERL